MDDEQLYEIRDGVRRAKAAWLCGQETIEARVNGNDPVLPIPLRSLRSPEKDSIDLAGMEGYRWHRVLRATQAGLPLPPIWIVPGDKGPTVEEVKVDKDELDAFR